MDSIEPTPELLESQRRHFNVKMTSRAQALKVMSDNGSIHLSPAEKQYVKAAEDYLVSKPIRLLSYKQFNIINTLYFQHAHQLVLNMR